jgi:hypothetical protein
MFLRDRFAQIATQIGHAQRKPASWMHETARTLFDADKQRQEVKGKPMSDDHLKQMAVKLAKDTAK